MGGGGRIILFEDRGVEAYLKDMIELLSMGYIFKDIVIVGGGPAGLTACYLASRQGLRTLLVERNMFYGGFMWYSSFMGSVATLSGELSKLLDDLGISYFRDGDLVYVSTPILLGRLIAGAAESGCSMVNFAVVEDLLVDSQRISGVKGRFIDPSESYKKINNISYIDNIDLVVRARYTILTTGGEHINRFEKSLSSKDLYNDIRRFNIASRNDISNESLRELIINNTREIHPGLIVAGAAVAKMVGLSNISRVGYGIPMVSAMKAVEIVVDRLESTISKNTRS